MKNQNEKNLNSIFDEKSLNKTLKKVKRVTFLRTLLISVIVSILIVIGVFKLNNWWIDKTGSELAAEGVLEDTIMMTPNTFVRTETIEIGILKGTIKKEVFKIIEDKIIPWQKQDVHFGFRGFQSTSYSSYSTTVNETTQINIPSGEREMLFYVPQYKYKTYANDLEILNEYPSDKYIELAISFDKGYSLSQVKEMLPDAINQTWYWINNYPIKSEERAQPESGQWLYGISQPTSDIGKALSPHKIKTESDFLAQLKKVNKNDYQFLKKQQEKGLIIGGVVTGTKEELLSLQGLSYVKATSLGVVIEKY